MPLNFFITGMPKTGKTTLLARIAAELKSHGLRVGGFLSPAEKTHGTRTGFYIQDIASGEMGELADVSANGPKVSKYHVEVKEFESIALPILRDFEKYDVVIIDEIGRMELKSQRFSDALDRVLESHTPLIASLHSDYVDRYAQSGEVIFLEDNNHESVYRELVERIKAIGKKPKAAKPAKAPAKKAVAKPAKKAAPLKKAKPVQVKKATPKKMKAARKAETVKTAKKPQKKAGKRGEGKGVVEHLKDLLGF